MSRARSAYREGECPVPGYRLIESLGHGNFGVVWLASAPGGMEVALKVIDLSGREGAKEFEALQRVKHVHHPNLVPVFASWLLTDDGQILDDLTGLESNHLLKNRSAGRTAGGKEASNGNPSRVVELIIAMGLGSKNLAFRLEECIRAGLPGIPYDELLDYMDGAARGIDYLNEPIHDLGEGLVPIIHGDIKPHNILIVGNAVQVCDFGLARAIQSLRKTSTGMGTFAYAAPELLEGKASRASDQYCLAITYVELVSGDLPFDETNALKVVEIHRRGELNLSALRPNEREVIQRAVAVDPALRWPSCSTMVRALRRACERDEIALRSGSTPTDTDEAVPPLASLAPFAGTLVIPTIRPAGTGRVPVVRPIAETAPLGSELTARPQPKHTFLHRPMLLIATLSLLVGIAIGGYYLMQHPFWRPPTDRIEALVLQDRIGPAFNMSETLYENGEQKRELVEYAVRCWKKRIVQLVAQGDYAKAMVDAKEAPSSSVPDSTREEMRQTIFDVWSKQVEKSAAENQFAEAFAEYGKAAVQVGDLRETVLAKLYDDWSKQIQTLARTDQLAEAIRVSQDAPDSIRQASPAHWNEPLRYIHEVWAGRIPVLTNEHAFGKVIEVWEAGYPAWRKDERGRKLLAEAIEHWSAHVKEYVSRRQFAEAFEFLAKMPERYDEKKLGQEVVHSWRDCVLALGAQNQFDKAFKVLDEVPEALVSAETQNELLENLKAVWANKVADLGGQGRFDEALQALEQAHPGWVDRKTELYGQLQKMLLARIDGLLEKDKFQEALDWIDNKAHRRLVDTEVDRRRSAIRGKWLSVIDRQQEPAKSESLTVLARYFSNAPLAPTPPPQRPQTPPPLASRERIEQIEKRLASRESTEVNKALEETADLLHSEKLASPLAIRLQRALGNVSSQPQVDAAMKCIRDFAMTHGAQNDAVAALRKLWTKKIAISIKGQDTNLKQNQAFELFQTDSAYTGWRGTDTGDGLVNWWLVERWIESGKPPTAIPDAPPAGISETANDRDLILYGHYVRARCLEAVARRDGNVPNWVDIAEELAIVFAKPPTTVILAVSDRRDMAIKLAIDAANGLRKPQWRSGGPLDSPFDKPHEAELCSQLLAGVYALDPKLLDDSTRIILALAALNKPEPDRQLASTLTARLVNLSDVALGQDAVLVLFAYLRTHVEDAARGQSALVSFDACTRVCNLMRDIAITADDAKTLYEQVLHPVELLADGIAKPTMAADARARLLQLYDAVYELAAKNKRLAWPVKDVDEWCEMLLTKAIGTANAGDPRSAQRYLDRARLRFERQERNPDLRGLDLVIQDIDEARQRKPSMVAAHGLASQVYLIRSRIQPTSPRQLADLTEAIHSGQKAVAQSEAGDRASFALSLSSACVERANCDKTNQAVDLQLARDMANKAADLMKQGRPDFPYLAQGNAFEDVAWLMEDEPEKNYLEAIEAFENAARKKLFSAQASCSIGRCYYRMVVATCLYPGVDNEPERNRLMEKCKAELQHALKLDPTLVEAYYFLGLAHQYQRRYKEADAAYEKAKSIAVKQKLSARAIYIARWAMFPLENTTLDTPSQCAEAERRAKELVVSPAPPGASLDPRKDIVYIQAEIQNRQGKIVEAKQICDEALKNLSTADRSDVNLLLARSRYEIQLANSRKSLEDAKAAIADAERAVQAALVREVIVEALATAANARFEAYALSPEQQYFNDAIANASEIANKLAPRRPISARLCAMVAVEYGRKFVTLGAGTPAEKFQLVDKAIDWQFPSVSWENDRTAQNQLAGELVQLFKAAIPQVNALRETAPQRLVELRKAVDKWMVMIQKIAEDVPERKEVAAQLEQLKQTLHQ